MAVEIEVVGYSLVTPEGDPGLDLYRAEPNVVVVLPRVSAIFKGECLGISFREVDELRDADLVDETVDGPKPYRRVLWLRRSS